MSVGIYSYHHPTCHLHHHQIRNFQVSDESISDEDTLSLSNENLLDKEAVTDTEEAAGKEEPKEDIEIKITEDSDWVEELPELTQISYPTVVTLRPRCGSEAPTERSSRSSLRGGRGGFERTQSVDRVFRRAGSPVFYLEPTDWMRTQGSTPSPRNSPLLKEPREVREGSSPLPYKDKLPNPMKLLESLGCGLDVLTESEENLSLEVEELTSVSQLSSRDHLGLEVEVMEIGAGPPRTKSDPGVGWTGMEARRVEEEMREEERRKSEDVVRRRMMIGEENEERREELLRRREESRSRSVTPGRFGETRHRKTPIPVLCSRGAWMVTILMRRTRMMIVEHDDLVAAVEEIRGKQQYELTCEAFIGMTCKLDFGFDSMKRMCLQADHGVGGGLSLSLSTSPHRRSLEALGLLHNSGVF